MNLTPKQRRFVGEYLKDLNGIQAAIRAGYQSKARRTREAYASAWSMFTRWYEQHGESPLPASVQRIVAYHVLHGE